MTAIIDTEPLVAIANQNDPHHERGQQVIRDAMSGRYGDVMSLDLVLLEGLTLIQRRTKDERIAHLFASYFQGAQGQHEPLVKTRQSTDLIERTVDLYFRYYDRKLSSVDCALIAIAQITNGVLVTFDKGFEGLVPVASR